MALFFFNPKEAKTSDNKNWESFCFNCEEVNDGRLECNCGENMDNFNWQWMKQIDRNVILSMEDREVLFHPVYSTGTAAVRGMEAFKPNQHHYWEIKVLTNLYGTDIMVGVGTSKVSLSERQYKFCSLLGYDNQSWGYSYHGLIQHDKLTRKYGELFGLGSIIGVHLDMCEGKLEYYLNRKPLGTAFKGLKQHELFPMVSSTAAQSSLRMTCSLSLAPTLQLQCLLVIQKYPHLISTYRKIPGLSRLIKGEYFWLIPQPPKVSTIEDSFLQTFEGELFFPLQTFLHSANSAKRRKCLQAQNWYSRNTHDTSMRDNLRIIDEMQKGSKELDSIIRAKTSRTDSSPVAVMNNIRELIENLASEDTTKHNFNQSTASISAEFNAVDEIDMIVKCDKYLNCTSHQEDVNLNKPSCSSMVYEDLDIKAAENDVPNSENRCCESCNLNLGTGSELSPNTLCSFCDVII